ncbi:MAG: hypothetical protein JO217_03765 [Acidobacteriaceae bacterium]|nr:hypothetical protein [Acidobacteriaceae bacterium]
MANPDNARFCANCGTQFGARSAVPRTGNTVAKNIGLGCLIALVIVLFFGLSCTRACFGHRYGRGPYVIRRR